MAAAMGLHILLFVMLCSRVCYSRRVLVTGNEKSLGLHSHAEGGEGSGTGRVGGGGYRSVTLLYDWPCGSELGCPHCPNHGVCRSCDCASCEPPCYNPFDPLCSGWVMGLSNIASTTKPGLNSATCSPLHKVPSIPKQADQHLS